MTKESSIRSLIAFIKAAPKNIVVCLWSGIPCTGGSPMQNANKHKPGHAQRMSGHLRLWTKLFNGFVKAAQEVVHRGGHLVLEWPSRCRYWKNPKVKALLAIKELGWEMSRVRSCAHGQIIASGVDKGKCLTKCWRIYSTIPGLSDTIGLPCPGGHVHVTTASAHTLQSGKYPPQLALCFHAVFNEAKLQDSDAYRSTIVTSCLGPTITRDCIEAVACCAVLRVAEPAQYQQQSEAQRSQRFALATPQPSLSALAASTARAMSSTSQTPVAQSPADAAGGAGSQGAQQPRLLTVPKGSKRSSSRIPGVGGPAPWPTGERVRKAQRDRSRARGDKAPLPEGEAESPEAEQPDLRTQAGIDHDKGIETFLGLEPCSPPEKVEPNLACLGIVLGLELAADITRRMAVCESATGWSTHYSVSAEALAASCGLPDLASHFRETSNDDVGTITLAKLAQAASTTGVETYSMINSTALPEHLRYLAHGSNGHWPRVLANLVTGSDDNAPRCPEPKQKEMICISSGPALMSTMSSAKRVAYTDSLAYALLSNPIDVGISPAPHGDVYRVDEHEICDTALTPDRLVRLLMRIIDNVCLKRASGRAGKRGIAGTRWPFTLSNEITAKSATV